MAEFVAHQWGTGKADRQRWFTAKKTQGEASTVPFTQYNGVLSSDEWRRGPLYDVMAPTPRGAPQFRRATDGMRCIQVPSADVEIGGAEPDAKPLRRVKLAEFIIDAEPVSVQAYARFLNSIGTAANEHLERWCVLSANDRRRKHFQLEQHGKLWRAVRGTAHQPMILVSWFGAHAYALWANRLAWRDYAADACAVLPTEAQWEYAARDVDGGHVGLHRARATYDLLLPLAPVNAQLGMSHFNLHHMAGNVWHWCADWYSPDFFGRLEAGRPNPRNDEPTGIRSERGGSWVGPGELSRPSYRRGRPPHARGRCLGFRCVNTP